MSGKTGTFILTESGWKILALTTPFLDSQIIIDASKDNQIRFTVLGGDQFDGLLYKVYNESGTIVYNAQITTTLARFTIPAGKLTNGTTYKLTVTTMRGTSNNSTESDYAALICYSSPTVKINNLTFVNNTYSVSNQNFEFSGSYSSPNRIALSYYYYTLYDAYGNILQTYTYNYNTVGTNLTQYVAGMDNGVTYKISLTCVDQYGIKATSNTYTFVVNYVPPRIGQICKLENNCSQASVKISGEIRQMRFKAVNGKNVFVNNNTALDLYSTNGAYLGEGLIDVYHNFSIQIWGENLSSGKTFITIRNGEDYIYAYYNKTKRAIYCYKNFNGHLTIYRSDTLTFDLTNASFYIMIKQHIGRIDIIVIKN